MFGDLLDVCEAVAPVREVLHALDALEDVLDLADHHQGRGAENEVLHDRGAMLDVPTSAATLREVDHDVGPANVDQILDREAVRGLV
jgi:hypothetical protein